MAECKLIPTSPLTSFRARATGLHTSVTRRFRLSVTAYVRVHRGTHLTEDFDDMEHDLHLRANHEASPRSRPGIVWSEGGDVVALQRGFGPRNLCMPFAKQLVSGRSVAIAIEHLQEAVPSFVACTIKTLELLHAYNPDFGILFTLPPHTAAPHADAISLDARLTEHNMHTQFATSSSGAVVLRASSHTNPTEIEDLLIAQLQKTGWSRIRLSTLKASVPVFQAICRTHKLLQRHSRKQLIILVDHQQEEGLHHNQNDIAYVTVALA